MPIFNAFHSILNSFSTLLKEPQNFGLSTFRMNSQENINTVFKFELCSNQVMYVFLFNLYNLGVGRAGFFPA